MISIGNDIISLKHTNAERTQQKKFYSKILSKSEIELFNKIIDSISFEDFVWLAWSIKESVYKFYKRNNPETLFSPVKIIIENFQAPHHQIKKMFGDKKYEPVSFKYEECFCCEINFNSTKFYTRTFVWDDVIFTMANNKNCFENIYWGIKNIGSDLYSIQAQKVRLFLIDRLNKIFPGKNLFIEKTSEGLPVLMHQKQLYISFTHHGNFVAYAFTHGNITDD